MILLVAACSPYNPDADDPATAPDTIGAEGGTVSSNGVELDIPPGALDEPVQIRIVDLGIEPPEPYEGLSTVWSFEPEGLVFDEPVTVTLPFQEHPLPQLFWSQGEGYIRLQDVTFEGGHAVASIEHFSTAFVAITPAEVHEQPYQVPPADILFIVDNSCSMFEFQQALTDETPAMFASLTGAGLDYHIGVISTDMEDGINGQGKLRNVAGQSYIEPATTNPEQAFSLMVNMGTAGWYDEKGRAAAWTMVELKRDIPRNAGFYRDDATLDFVFLSDEEDQSGGNPITRAEFISWMDALKPTPTMTRAHAIAQSPGNLCQPSGSAGTEYAAYANATGGALIDLCSDDWATPLTALVDHRLAEGVIELPVVPSEVVSVTLESDTDIELAPTEYTLDGAQVHFDQGVVPALGQNVVVHYRP